MYPHWEKQEQKLPFIPEFNGFLMWGQIEIDIPGFPRSFDDWGQI